MSSPSVLTRSRNGCTTKICLATVLRRGGTMTFQLSEREAKMLMSWIGSAAMEAKNTNNEQRPLTREELLKKLAQNPR